jgi:hypothetical protein
MPRTMIGQQTHALRASKCYEDFCAGRVLVCASTHQHFLLLFHPLVTAGNGRVLVSCIRQQRRSEQHACPPVRRGPPASALGIQSQLFSRPAALPSCACCYGHEPVLTVTAACTAWCVLRPLSRAVPSGTAHHIDTCASAARPRTGSDT